MKFYKGKEQLSLVSDESGISLGTDLLHAGDRILFSKEKTPGDSAFPPIVFTNQSLTSVKT